MGTEWTSEILVFYHISRRDNPEDLGMSTPDWSTPFHAAVT